jgi:hypothetical protein
MDLRELQAPLKARYREEPEAAFVTLRASGELGEGVSCSVQTGRALAEAGLHPATGGDGTLGFAAIRLRFDLDTDADEEQLATLFRLTERYCVVLQTITGGVQVSLVH